MIHICFCISIFMWSYLAVASVVLFMKNRCAVAFLDMFIDVVDLFCCLYVVYYSYRIMLTGAPAGNWKLWLCLCLLGVFSFYNMRSVKEDK